ncbi:MAG: hypothetical protein U0271_43250 [Polyangiaceae bacterium]
MDGPAVTFQLELGAKRCYRIFAVGAAGVADLDVEVQSSRGTVIASDHEVGRVAIVQPDRPFCSTARDTATIIVEARDGAGAFALDILEMEAPENDGDAPW